MFSMQIVRLEYKERFQSLEIDNGLINRLGKRCRNKRQTDVFGMGKSHCRKQEIQYVLLCMSLQLCLSFIYITCLQNRTLI